MCFIFYSSFIVFLLFDWYKRSIKPARSRNCSTFDQLIIMRWVVTVHVFLKAITFLQIFHEKQSKISRHLWRLVDALYSLGKFIHHNFYYILDVKPKYILAARRCIIIIFIFLTLDAFALVLLWLKYIRDQWWCIRCLKLLFSSWYYITIVINVILHNIERAEIFFVYVLCYFDCIYT